MISQRMLIRLGLAWTPNIAKQLEHYMKQISLDRLAKYLRDPWDDVRDECHWQGWTDEQFMRMKEVMVEVGISPEYLYNFILCNGRLRGKHVRWVTREELQERINS